MRYALIDNLDIDVVFGKNGICLFYHLLTILLSHCLAA